MLGRTGIIITAALLAGCAGIATAADGRQDLRSPDARDEAQGGRAVEIDGRRQPLSNYHPPGVSSGAPAQAPTRAAAPIEVRVSSDFDWRDAGIGAAGMLALVCIGAGSALLIAGRRRRQGFRVGTR
jgi:hypothetical protein